MNGLINWILGGGLLAISGAAWKGFMWVKEYVDKQVQGEREKCELEKKVLQEQIDELKGEVFGKKLDVFRSTSLPMWVKNVKGEVKAVNPAFLFSIASNGKLIESDIVGRKLGDVFPAVTSVVNELDNEARRLKGATHKYGVKFYEDDVLTYTIRKELLLMGDETVLFGIAIPEN